MTHGVLITGCNGGIGKSLASSFHEAGWFVVGVDMSEQDATVKTHKFFKCDLAEFVENEEKLNAFVGEVRAALGKRLLRDAH